MIDTKKLERLLFQLTIFLIPSNLAYHWVINGAYINGRLVDYLLPKLYVSDLTLLGVISLYVFNNRHNIDTSSFFKSQIKNPLIYLIWYTVMRAWFTPLSQASLWYAAKIVEFVLFGWYVHHQYTAKQLLTIITKPLIVSMVIQTVLCLYQFINQSSLFEYFFMGEPSLESVGIVKNSYFGLLEKAPYGTTPHPNIVAGFIAIGSLLVFLRTQLIPNCKVKKTVYISLISLNLLFFYLTQSLGAIIAFASGFLAFQLQKRVSTKTFRLIVLMYCASTIICSSLIIQVIHQQKIITDNPSIDTRYELIKQATATITSNPLFGVGPNMFTNHLNNSPIAGQKSYFIQPVHNGLLLILSEYGLVITGLCMYRIYYYIKNQKTATTMPLYLVPIVGIVTIVSVDHYPITLQTGQLLTVICIVLALQPSAGHKKTL
jgi:hypothetical protein